MNPLLQKLQNRSATVGIIGLGFVGLPLFLCFAESGVKVVGFDVDGAKIESLKNHQSYIAQFDDTMIAAALMGVAEVSDDFSRISQCDALIICVPTPLANEKTSDAKTPDLSFITTTLATIRPYLRPYQMIALESTVWPGATEEVLAPIIEGAGFTIGSDFSLVFSPERTDPGNALFTTKTIPKIVSGVTAACLDAGIALYETAIDTVVAVNSTKIAEMAKLLENIHRAVNIGLVNEMKLVADAMGIDIFAVIDAAATKPFGFTPYYSGPGLGGHCIPIDPVYLTWKARQYGIDTRFIALSGKINGAMPEFVMGKLTDALNIRGKMIEGSKILILGLAYKANVDDTRESPSVALMQLLAGRGAEVAYHDPYLPHFPTMRGYDFDLSSVDITDETLADFDAVILATGHDGVDYALIAQHAPLIIDTRGVYRHIDEKIIRA